MTLCEMYIVNLKDKEILKKYVFNPVGVNIILGVAKSDSNGVGKTAMIDAIRMVLGEKLPEDFRQKEELAKRDIMIVIKIDLGERYEYLGRQIIDADTAYISNKFIMDLRGWEPYEIDKYRIKIQEYMYDNMVSEGAPSFQSIREYIIRDEKKGFNGIGLSNRQASQVNQCLVFLSLLPTHYEADIRKLKNEKANLEADIKVIKTIAKDIVKLKSDKIKIESEIKIIRKMLDTVDVSDKIDYDEERYLQAKKRLKQIESRIFKNEFSKKQFESNFENLEQKHKKMQELVNLQAFYSQLMDYFPEKLSKNYEEMDEFFAYMLENRGDYFKKRIKLIDDDTEKLKVEKIKLQEIISISTQIFQNTQIVEDIHNINEQLNREYERLADVKMKIDKYNEINDLKIKVNRKEKEILEKMLEYQKDYNLYNDYVENIHKHFLELVDTAYKEEGELTYWYEDELNKKSPTGRIIIKCEIDAENSHGRLYMKINMFDLALFMNRIDNHSGCQILIHDGSYCKPSLDAKGKIINYADNYLKSCNSGQYFVTINRTEIEKSTLTGFVRDKLVIAEFDRSPKGDKNFFGFKY